MIGKITRYKRKDGSDRWAVEFHRGPGGRIYRFPTSGTLLTKETAEVLLTQVRHAVLVEGRELESVLADCRKPAKELEVLSFAKEYDQALYVRGVSINTREVIRRYFTTGYFCWWEGFTISQVDFARVAIWASTLRQQGLSGKTIQNVLGAFRAFLIWLRDEGRIQQVPVFPRVKVVEYEPTILSPTEQQRVLDHIPEDQRGIFLCMCLGVRPSEARALKVSDYFFYGDQAYLRISKAMKGRTRSGSHMGGTKTGKVRVIPIDKRLQEWIEKHRQGGFWPGDFLFVNPRGIGIWTSSAIDRVWQRAARKAGVRCSAYEGTKHSFATNLLREGHDLKRIKEFLGHSDIRSTERYARLSGHDLVDLVGGGRDAGSAQARAGDREPEVRSASG